MNLDDKLKTFCATVEAVPGTPEMTPSQRRMMRAAFWAGASTLYNEIRSAKSQNEVVEMFDDFEAELAETMQRMKEKQEAEENL